MVTKNNILPYPSPSLSQPPPQPLSLPTDQDAHHGIDSTNLPPLPKHTSRRDLTSPAFENADNPWSDIEPIEVLESRGTGSEQERSRIPDALRPGRSAELTPTSSREPSLERDERDWWDDEEENEEQQQQQPQQNTAVNGDFSTTARFKPVKRKPVPSAHPVKVEPDLASNNPYRRPSAGQPSEQDVWAGTSREQHGEGRHDLLRGSSAMADRLDDGVEEKQTLDSLTPTPLLPAHPPPPIPGLQPPIPPQITGLSLDPWSTEKPMSTAPSPIPFNSSQQHETIPTSTLLDRGRDRTRAGSLSLSDELMDIPNALPPKLPNIPAGSPISLPLHDERDLQQDRPGATSVLESAASDFSADNIQHSSRLFSADSPASTAPIPVTQLRQVSPRPVNDEPSLLGDDGDEGPRPQLPPRRSTRPDTPSSRPVVVTALTDETHLAEQRSETYQVKHFNWFDHRSKKLRRSSMLTQNKNGPCPLLALVNAMILGATEEMQATLDDALRLREQITLGLIIETLMDELLNRSMLCDGSALPEIDQLNMFLMRLRTGMNANPRFVPAAGAETQFSPPQAGAFELTSDIKLYNSFGVQLLHGWLPLPDEEVFAAFARSAPTYEDAQAVQFGEEELEYKLSSSESGLTEQEQKLWQDIISIKQFLQAHPTQLTPYGLQSIKNALRSGEFAILFRNDHFSTIYKNPRDGSLYTLITDEGYAERDEIIWESLSDISGARSEFFSGDFQSVSHLNSSTSEPYRHPIPHSQTPAANPRRSMTSPYAEQQTPSVGGRSDVTATAAQQAQSDADFAMALQLQEEEEQQMRRARQSQAVNSQPANSNTATRGAGGGRGSTATSNSSRGRGQITGRRTASNNSNIPITLRSNRSSTHDENRPTIPPRRQRDGVTRPSDANDPDAPPAYEEATRSPVYAPPIGSPLHPHSSADLSARASTSTTTVHATGQSSGFPFSSSTPTLNLHSGGSTNADRNASMNSDSAHNFNSTPGVLANRAREQQIRNFRTSSATAINTRSTARPLNSTAYNETTSTSASPFSPGYASNDIGSGAGRKPDDRERDRDRDRECSVM